MTNNEKLKHALAALAAVADLADGNIEPEAEDYHDTESAYNNGMEVALWEAAKIAKDALEAIK